MVEEILKFRRLLDTSVEGATRSIDDIDIPVKLSNRHCTDKMGITLYLITIVTFLPFLIYTLYKSDIRRYKYVYDKCGNMCGYRNPRIEGVPCSGIDYSTKPLGYSSKERSKTFTCVSKCPNGTEELYIPKKCAKTWTNDLTNISGIRSVSGDVATGTNTTAADSLNLITQYWWKILVVFSITIMAGVLLLALVKFTPTGLVWGIIIVSIPFSLGVATALWVTYYYYPYLLLLLIVAIICTVYAVIVTAFLICYYRAIPLVIDLFREATDVVTSIPLFLCIPFAVIVVQSLMVAVFIITTLWLFSARELRKKDNNNYNYEINRVMETAISLNIIVMVWSVLIFRGLVNMTVAGSVAAWFFAKNRETMTKTLCTHLRIACRYHFGTAVLGSLVISVGHVINTLLEPAARFNRLKSMCPAVFDTFKSLSMKAYIETAIHGQPFCKSGMRALKILMSNLDKAMAIINVPSTIVMMVMVLIVFISTVISIELFKNVDLYLIPCAICFFVNIILVCIMFSIIDDIVETLFICCCEDKEINNGESRPYCMSKRLLECIEKTQNVSKK